jgi:DNA-binding MarR family transcriptional regulator
MADKTTESVRIADLIDRVSRAVQRLQYTGGLNPAQWVALRYIAQANRYSRSPSAVAEYLGTTKGTASQTLKALVQKGCMVRTTRAGDGRAVELVLTEAGAAKLENDPLNRIGGAVREISDQLSVVNTSFGLLLRRLQEGSGFREFGFCGECSRLCRECAQGEANGPHMCGVTGEALSGDEIHQICVNFESQPG